MERCENMKLSIIIPVYNAEKYLKQCLESVLKQSDEQIEVIVVNDGSTDSSIRICEKYAEKYNNIKLINKDNEGVSKARNIAIQQAQGEWVTFLDADDMLQENALVVLNELDDNVDVLLCDYSKGHVKNESDISKKEIPSELLMKSILNIPLYITEIRKHSYKIDSVSNWTCWGKFFRTKMIKDNQIMFPEGITHGEDLLFCYQIYKSAPKVYYCPIYLYFYRTNNESVSLTFNPRRITNTIRLFENFLQIDKNLIDNQDFQHFVVDRIIACCKLYFANKKNTKEKSEKLKELKELLQIDYINRAIHECSLRRLSLGKKTSIVYFFVLLFLKKQRYDQAILISKI